MMLKRLLVALLTACVISGSTHAQAISAATTNASVTITTGNTFQTILAALGSPPTSARRSLTIENNNSTDNCWVYVGSGSPTKGTSILLTPGGSYTRYYPYVPSDAIQATCTTTNDTLYVDFQ